jgi:hypothetical protein
MISWLKLLLTWCGSVSRYCQFRQLKTTSVVVLAVLVVLLAVSQTTSVLVVVLKIE